MENLCTQQVLASFCYNNLKVNIYPKKKKKEKTKLKVNNSTAIHFQLI